ncbi:NADH-quinone oxidoreductase subunit J [Desulfitispora alkaliphila]|uniref:NADH-quinone oxidoreductase subunit J family protein n=1 Tax=Desulfitispora alkaliphila TaxID=622674 RepID=UPI003D2481DA
MDVLIFWVLSAIIICSALGVVLLNNIVHSAILMMLTFIGIAGIFFTLHADFLGLVQILIYVGAVSILVVFGIMLTRRGDIKNSNPFNSYKYLAMFASAGLFFLISVIVWSTNWALSSVETEGSYVGPIIETTLIDFLVPFQLAGILLLVAMVGAIVLAKGVKNTK